MFPDSNFRIAPIGINCHQLKKWGWHCNFSKWHHRQFFWRCRVLLVKFNYYDKFHANIITGSGVIKICFYMWFHQEIGNTPVWVLTNVWSLKWVRIAKSCINVFNKKLSNAEKYQVSNFYCFLVIKGKPTRGEGDKNVSTHKISIKMYFFLTRTTFNSGSIF